MFFPALPSGLAIPKEMKIISGIVWDPHGEGLVPCCVLVVWYGTPLQSSPLTTDTKAALSAVLKQRRLQ